MEQALLCFYAGLSLREVNTCFRFYEQMKVEKNAFAYRIYSHFTQQLYQYLSRQRHEKY
jgi:hypothetical protein